MQYKDNMSAGDMIVKTKVMRKIGMNYLSYKMGHPKPFFCGYSITSRCNLTCKHCSIYSPYRNDENLKSFIEMFSTDNELTTEQAKYAIDQIDKLGVFILHFSGGEPLLRKDLEEIALYAKRKGMYTSLDTNGTLITKERAKSLTCFHRIAVSIDGIGETHEEIRGKNTFKKTIRGIKYLKEYSNSNVGAIFTINKLNYMEMEEMIDFAKVNCDFIDFSPINVIKELFLDRDTANKVGEKLVELKRKNKYFMENTMEYLKLFNQFLQGKTVIDCNIECHPFILYCILNPDGNVSGCVDICSQVGNILEEDIMELHRRGELMKEEVRSKCMGCSYACVAQNTLLFQQPIYKTITDALPKLLRM